MAKLVHEHSPRGRSRWRDHRSLHLRGGRRPPDFPELRSPPSLSGLETRQSIRNQLARKGSAADVAGIKIGDVIKSYDDTKVISHHELIRAIGEYLAYGPQLGAHAAPPRAGPALLSSIARARAKFAG